MTVHLRPQCVKAKPGRGGSISLHPQEGLLQEAQAFQDSAAFAPYRALQQVAKYRWARLVQLGLRQARDRGRFKTEAQLLLDGRPENAPGVVPRNLTAIPHHATAQCAAPPGGRRPPASPNHCTPARAAGRRPDHPWPLTTLDWLPNTPSSIGLLGPPRVRGRGLQPCIP